MKTNFSPTNFGKFVICAGMILFVYFFIGALIALIGEYNYRGVLCHPAQILAAIFCYWWPCVAWLADVAEQEEAVTARGQVTTYGNQYR